MDKKYYIYMMTNENNTVLYTGVTSDLNRRVKEHKDKMIPGFSKRYNISKLVYYEEFAEMDNAIRREKQVKAGSRQKKISLIESINKDWKDLFEL
ncbi:GIY-YIG nuclease family protein [candidate division KSB1 bacterium]